MNAKACKRMRRMAVAATDVVSQYKPVDPIIKFGRVVFLGQRELLSDCQRAVYKELKRHYAAANQTVRAHLNAQT